MHIFDYDPNLTSPAAIMTSVFVALVSYIRTQESNKKNNDMLEAKEQHSNLYVKLNALIEKKWKYLTFLKLRQTKAEEDDQKYANEYYQFYLELRDLYLENQVYGSLDLFTVFHTLNHNHEMEYRNFAMNSETHEEALSKLAKYELSHGRDKEDNSEFERKMEELIKVIKEDIYRLDGKKPVERFYKENS